jgi:hypothetical protein
LSYRCLTSNNKTTQDAFLKLPKLLYKKHCPQDKSTETRLLKGTHVLSSNIEVHPFVIVDNDDNPVCRCLMTYYNNSDTAYIGFFEARNNLMAVKKMFAYVERKAKSDHKIQLLGPIDASIYINYRFKVDHFDKIYTGEPYNKEYYENLWEEIGFTISDRYLSNQMRRVEVTDFDERLERIYQRYLSKGYQFVEPNKDDFDDRLEDVYKLLTNRYSNFAGSQPISADQFIAMFSDLETIMNHDMIKLVYKDGDLKAFCIAVPNYGELTHGHVGLFKLWKILKIKRHPSEYVILYAGADAQSPGLGGAVMHVIRNELYKNQCTSIGALIHEGNMPAQVYSMLHTDQYHYVLMKKHLE